MPLKLKNFKFEKSKGIGKLILNRPKYLNVFNLDTLTEFRNTLMQLAKDESIVVLILKSNHEKVFTAGADIREMLVKDAVAAWEFAEIGHSIANKLESFPVPVIASINGYCMGGGVEFVCACDLRIASENASFAQPEIDIGIVPGWGGTQRLTRIIGYGKAKELIYTGRQINAIEALELGLVNNVVEHDKLEKATAQLAQVINSKGRCSLVAAKELMNLRFETSESKGLREEIHGWADLFGTHDQKEGMKAFLERRKPKFKHR
jgi:enoyl-CoA hydratase/carnithine racemase